MMNIDQALNALSEVTQDPTRGLPEEIFRYASSIVPMINVDLLIKNDFGHTLMTWRVDEFHPSGWHIPGGIIRYKETVHDRILAVALNELGASVLHDHDPVAVHEIIMEPEWRIRGHFISLLFKCRLQEIDMSKFVKDCHNPQPGECCWHSVCPEKLYAAHEIYRQYL